MLKSIGALNNGCTSLITGTVDLITGEQGVLSLLQKTVKLGHDEVDLVSTKRQIEIQKQLELLTSN